MSRKLIVRTALLAFLVLTAVVLWPDVAAILTVGAAVLLAAGVVAVDRWTERRRRDESQPGTEARGTIPFTGWRDGGL